MFTPYDMFSRSLNFWMQTTLKAQQDWSKMATHFAAQMSSTQSQARKSSSNIPSDMMMDEARMREWFQSAANTNLRAWTDMAEQIAGLPTWVRWPYEAPGRSLTDMYDMFRPFPVFDAPEPSAAASVQSSAQISALVDDLTKIKGIGPKIAQRLSSLGIVRLEQIAAWSKADAQAADDALSLGGRILRQAWVKQAKKLS